MAEIRGWDVTAIDHRELAHGCIWHDEASSKYSVFCHIHGCWHGEGETAAECDLDGAIAQIRSHKHTN